MNTFTQRNGIAARTVDATLEAPRGLFQDNVIGDATLADDAMRPVLTTRAELRPIGGDDPQAAVHVAATSRTVSMPTPLPALPGHTGAVDA
jgi:hypothetical protein